MERSKMKVRKRNRVSMEQVTIQGCKRVININDIMILNHYLYKLKNN